MKKSKFSTSASILTIFTVVVFFLFYSLNASATAPEGEKIYTKYSNESGTKYCCCPGSMECGAVCCADC